MPRFFFHYRDGIDHIDHEGMELTEIEVARLLSMSSSGAAIKSLGGHSWEKPNCEVWVTDETGATVGELRFTDDPSQDPSS